MVPGFREGYPADRYYIRTLTLTLTLTLALPLALTLSRYYILRTGSLRVEQGGKEVGTIEEVLPVTLTPYPHPLILT